MCKSLCRDGTLEEFISHINMAIVPVFSMESFLRGTISQYTSGILALTIFLPLTEQYSLRCIYQGWNTQNVSSSRDNALLIVHSE